MTRKLLYLCSDGEKISVVFEKPEDVLFSEDGNHYVVNVFGEFRKFKIGTCVPVNADSVFVGTIGVYDNHSDYHMVNLITDATSHNERLIKARVERGLLAFCSNRESGCSLVADFGPLQLASLFAHPDLLSKKSNIDRPMNTV